MTSLAPTEGTSDDDSVESFLDPSMADTTRFPTSRSRNLPEPSSADTSGDETSTDEDPEGPDTVRSPKEALRA